MRRHVAALSALLLLVALSGAPAGPPAVAQPRPSPSLPTLAYFYQWFDKSSWDRAKIDYPAAGRYSSDDRSVMRRQVSQAQQAGIDGFIVSWKHSEVNDRRLRALMGVARELDFKLAVIYQGLDFQRDPLPISRVEADFHLFARAYAGDPVFDIFDQPLLIWSGTWKFSAADLERVTGPLRSTLLILATEKNPEGYRRVARSFEGDAYYWSSVDPATNRGHQAKLNALGSVVHASGGVWVAPFAPGFDARLVGGTREVLRRDGDTLRAEYSAAVASSPDALGLISWNEFSENTHVEPSRTYGDQALSALRELTEGRRIRVSPLAEDSSQQRGGGGMTVWAGLVMAFLLFLGLTAYSLGRRSGQATSAGAGRPRRAEPGPGRRRAGRLGGAVVAVVVGALVVALSGFGLRHLGRDPDAGPTPLYLGAQPVRDAARPVIAAAGDISCPPGRRGRSSKEFEGANTCRSPETADLVQALAPDAVLALGDHQYDRGDLRDFDAAYARTWGAFRDIIYPVPGNHEYGTPGARGYYAYFGDRAGEPDKGYYSYDLGSWHVVALNSECEHVGGCSADSPQAVWLQQDLRAHPRRCTLAYWHRPRFSSGAHGNNLDNDALWRILVGAQADLVVNAHDHDYERFAAMDGDGQSDPENGVVELVVGTGGASHYKFHFPEATSLERITGQNGVARLELLEDGYTFQFVNAPAGTVVDSGSASCH